MHKIFVDIETVPDQSEGARDRARAKVKPPANYKKQETIDNWWEKDAPAKIEEAYLETALDGAYGEIISIAWQVDDQDIKCLTRESHVSETALLADFFEDLYSQVGKPTASWIAHNSDVDLFFLQQRCWIRGIKPTINIPYDVRPGDTLAQDPMRMFRGYYSRKTISQDELYRILGGEPFEDDDIDGTMVYDLWKAEKYEIIRDYNIRDVMKLVYNYRRLMR